MLYSDYEIIEPKPPPSWVYYLPSLKNIWDNPISQHLYKPIRHQFIPPPIMGFLAAFGLSLFLNLIFQNEVFEDSATLASLSLSLGATSAAIGLYASIRIIINSLVFNPLRIRSLIERHTIDSWLSLPLNDTTLFHSLNFPSIVSCLKAYENVIAIYVGLVIPFYIFTLGNGIKFGEIFSTAEISSTLPASYAVWAIFLPLVLSLLLTNASGLYSFIIQGPYNAAFAVTHFAICWGLMYLIRMTWLSIFPADDLIDIPKVVAGELISVLIMIGLAWLTGRIGVMVFARFRRPGFYEEEWSSAAGMVR